MEFAACHAHLKACTSATDAGIEELVLDIVAANTIPSLFLATTVITAPKESMPSIIIQFCSLTSIFGPSGDSGCLSKGGRELVNSSGLAYPG